MKRSRRARQQRLGRQREFGLRQQAEAEKERADQNLYDSDMSLAQHAWDDGDLGYTLSLLEAHRPRYRRNGSARLRVVLFLEPLQRRSTDDPNQP